MKAEGWYLDPFDVHERRWFSAGTPTDLVRDAGVDSYEAPPAAAWDGPLDAVPPVPVDGDDLARADDVAAAGADYDAGRTADAALDAAAQSGLGFA